MLWWFGLFLLISCFVWMGMPLVGACTLLRTIVLPPHPYPCSTPIPSVVFTNLLVWPSKMLKILTLGTEEDSSGLVASGMLALPFCPIDIDLHWHWHPPTWVVLLFDVILVNYIISPKFSSHRHLSSVRIGWCFLFDDGEEIGARSSHQKRQFTYCW